MNAARRLHRMLRELDSHDLNSLAVFSRYADHTCMYDASTLQCTQEWIPWPVRWLLSRQSPKHISVSRALPSLKKLMEDVDSNLNKLRWRYVYRNNAQQLLL